MAKDKYYLLSSDGSWTVETENAGYARSLLDCNYTLISKEEWKKKNEHLLEKNREPGK